MDLFGSKIAMGTLLGAGSPWGGSSKSSVFNVPILGLDLSLLALPSQDASEASGAVFEGPKARAAKKAFTTVKAAAPWEAKGYKAADSSQLSAVRAMRSIIDSQGAGRSSTDPDLSATFTAYRAIDRLEVLAQAASNKGVSAFDREQLQRAFERGLEQLRTFVSTAKTDKLTLYYGSAASYVQSFALTSPSFLASGTGDVVASDPDAALTGLTGREKFQVKIGVSGGARETIEVDLSAAAHQPPTLRDVVGLVNAAIAASPSKWSTRFEVEQLGEKRYAIGYHLGAGELASLTEAGAPDALMVSVARHASGGNDSLTLRRYNEPGTALTGARVVGEEISVDRVATALKAAEIDAKAKSSGSNYVKPDPTVNAGLTVRASASDGQGNSYLVGTAQGDYGALQSTGTTSLFLTKLDSGGHVLWRRALGEATNVDGAAVSVDQAGNVSVAGSIAERTSSGSSGVDADMMVARFAADGSQLFRTTVSNPGADVARAITTDREGKIIVGGSGTSAGNQRVGLIMKVDTSGKLVQRQRLDDADEVSSLAVDPDGQVVALTRKGDEAAVHRYAADLTTDVAHFSLGAGVQARALAIAADGRIAIAGGSDVDVAGSSANTRSRSGSRDAFVTLLAKDLTTARTSYIGSAADDMADSVTFSGNSLYVGGRTYGSINGDRRGAEDGFVARVAVDDGTVSSVDQFGSDKEVVGSVQVDVVQGGGTHLGLLGLAGGELAPKMSATIVGQTGLKPRSTERYTLSGETSAITTAEGDTFRLQVDDGAIKTIAIDADETLASLRDKVKKVLGNAGMVSLPSSGYDTASLKIAVLPGHRFTLLSGKTTSDGGDALAKLGLTAGTYSSPKSSDVKVTPGGRFGLDLDETLSLGTEESAARAMDKLTSAAKALKDAYTSLFWNATKAKMADQRRSGSGSGGASSEDLARLANYKAALARLTAGNSTSAPSLL